MIVRDTDARFVIDPVSGEITNNSEKDTITQGSHNSEVFTFEMPRDIGHDMMNCNLVEVHYINIKAKDKTQTSEGIYKVNDLKVCPEDDKKVILSWTIDGSATVHQGTLSFSIHFKCISDDGKCLYRWPTKTFNKMGVTSCVDTTDAVMEENQDIIAEWEARISALEQSGGGGSGGADSLIVTYEGDQASHTSGEIFDHVSNVRGPVQLQYNDMYYQLLRADDSVAWFGYINDEGYATVVCVNGNEIEEYHFDYVPASYFDEVIGDISTALDHIIEIQEELIGG